MDYPIQPISTIEAQGRAAALSGHGPTANPYPEGTGHWGAWGLGFLIATQERFNAAQEIR